MICWCPAWKVIWMRRMWWGTDSVTRPPPPASLGAAASRVQGHTASLTVALDDLATSDGCGAVRHAAALAKLESLLRQLTDALVHARVNSAAGVTSFTSSVMAQATKQLMRAGPGRHFHGRRLSAASRRRPPPQVTRMSGGNALSAHWSAQQPEREDLQAHVRGWTHARD